MGQGQLEHNPKQNVYPNLVLITDIDAYIHDQTLTLCK